MNTYGSGTTVINDNSTMNNSGGGQAAPVFENYGSYTSLSRTSSLRGFALMPSGSGGMTP